AHQRHDQGAQLPLHARRVGILQRGQLGIGARVRRLAVRSPVCEGGGPRDGAQAHDGCPEGALHPRGHPHDRRVHRGGASERRFHRQQDRHGL
ncbi:unnamed protein product, partial [Ectocarpus sp. 12 AP-2014]